MILYVENQILKKKNTQKAVPGTMVGTPLRIPILGYVGLNLGSVSNSKFLLKHTPRGGRHWHPYHSHGTPYLSSRLLLQNCLNPDCHRHLESESERERSSFTTLFHLPSNKIKVEIKQRKRCDEEGRVQIVNHVIIPTYPAFTLYWLTRPSCNVSQ